MDKKKYTRTGTLSLEMNWCDSKQHPAPFNQLLAVDFLHFLLEHYFCAFWVQTNHRGSEGPVMWEVMYFCRTHRVPTLLWLSRSPPFPPATKPLIIKTSIFSWFQHHIKHIIHRRIGDSARVHLVTTETKTKTHTKTNTKTKTRTFKSKSSCIYKLNHSVLQ